MLPLIQEIKKSRNQDAGWGNSSYFFIPVFSCFLVFLFSYPVAAFAFNGPPPGSPPTGNGSIVTDASNRVGIGTAAPDQLLTVKNGMVHVANGATLTTTPGSTAGYGLFMGTDNTTGESRIQTYWDAGTAFLTFHTNSGGLASVERARVDANGLTTTGFKLTTGPAIGYVLTSDAAGVGTWQASAAGDITGVTAGTGLTGGGASGDVTLAVDSTVARTNAANNFGAFNQTFDTNVLVVNATNNRVGINTAVPNYPLTIVGDVNTTGVYRRNGVAGLVSSCSSGYALSAPVVSGGITTSGACALFGDISGVTAGTGLTGGGASGDVTLNVGAGSGISVAADTVAVDSTVARTNAANTFGAFDQTFDTNVLVVDAANNRVGVNVTPTTALDVAGQIKISGGSPGVGKVLTSDVAGLATWAAPAGGANYTVVKFTTSGSTGIVTASCPVGTKVFGGGCYGYYTNCRLRDTLPQSVILGDASEGWYCSFWQRGSDALCGGPGQRAYVVCM